MKGRKPALPPLRVHRSGPVPPAPEWLSDHAKAAWAFLSPLLGDFEKVDELAFGVLCATYGEYREAQDDVRENGLTYEATTKTGTRKLRNPSVEIAREARAAFWRGAAEFGITPTGRARLKVGKTGGELDEFEAFMGEAQ